MVVLIAVMVDMLWCDGGVGWFYGIMCMSFHLGLSACNLRKNCVMGHSPDRFTRPVCTALGTLLRNACKCSDCSSALCVLLSLLHGTDIQSMNTATGLCSPLRA